MHPIKSYMKAASVTEAGFAALVGTTASYVSQIVCGHRYPSRDLARQIEEATKGLVKAADILTWSKSAA